MTYEILDSARVLTESVAAGTLAGLCVHQLCSVAVGCTAGTTYRQQLSKNWTKAAGAAVGALTTIMAIPYYRQNPADTPLEHILEYTGAALVGAAAGLVLRPVGQAMSSEHGITHEFREHAGKGAIRGAVAGPLLYGAVNLLARIFPA